MLICNCSLALSHIQIQLRKARVPKTGISEVHVPLGEGTLIFWFCRLKSSQIWKISFAQLLVVHISTKDIGNKPYHPWFTDDTSETHSDSLIYQKPKNMLPEELKHKPEITFLFAKASWQYLLKSTQQIVTTLFHIAILPTRNIGEQAYTNI